MVFEGLFPKTSKVRILLREYPLLVVWVGV